MRWPVLARPGQDKQYTLQTLDTNSFILFICPPFSLSQDMELERNHTRAAVRQGQRASFFEGTDDDDDDDYVGESSAGGTAIGSGAPLRTRAQVRAISNAQRLNSIRGHPMFGEVLREVGLIEEGDAEDGMVLVDGSTLVYLTRQELGQLELLDDDEEEEEGAAAAAEEIAVNDNNVVPLQSNDGAN